MGSCEETPTQNSFDSITAGVPKSNVLTPDVNCGIASSCSKASGLPSTDDQIRTLRSGGRSFEVPIQNLTVSSKKGADPPISVTSKQLTRSLGFPAIPPSEVTEQPIPFVLVTEQTPTESCRERIPKKVVTGGGVGATGDAVGATGNAVGTADCSSTGLEVGTIGAVVGAMGVSVGVVDTSGTGPTVGESVDVTVGCTVGAGVGPGVGCELGMLEGEGLGATVREAVGCSLEMLVGEELGAIVGGAVAKLWIMRIPSSQNSEISSISARSLASESLLSLAVMLPRPRTCNSGFSGFLFRINAYGLSALHHLVLSARRKNASRIACLIIMLVVASTRTN